MTTGGAYTVSRFAVDAAKEVERLNAQIDLFWHQELDLYKKLVLREGMRVLECGCGPGYLMEKLSSEFPSSEFTGVEVDPELVTLANQRFAEKRLDTCSVLAQSITEMEFQEASFDLVISRLLLEHLTDPGEALTEVLRVLKPGGKAVFLDNDFDFHVRTWPPSPALNELYDAYKLARRADGGNPCIGRQLPALLTLAGFGTVDFRVLVAHSQIVGDEKFRKAEGVGIPAQLVRTGYLKPESLESASREWLTALSTKNHSICRILFVAIGTKGETDNRDHPQKDGQRVNHSEEKPLNESKPTTNIPSLTEIKELMREVLAAEMDIAVDEVPLEGSLVAAGVDSLAALGLCNKIKGQFQVPFELASVLSGKSISELSAEVLRGLKAHKGQSFAIPLQPRHN